MSVTRYWDSPQMQWVRVALAVLGTAAELTPQAMYRALEMYYLNNGVYDAVQQAAYENSIWIEGMKGLRNPAHRTVEFYVAKLWPGSLPDALPILAKNKSIIPAIQQVWDWSNWGAKKQLAARWFALFGDWFVKVATRVDETGRVQRVYHQQIKPEFVTDFSVDERGFITYIRVDIPQTRQVEGQAKSMTHTEVWSKSPGMMHIWEHDKGSGVSLNMLNAPNEEKPLSAFGIDFVPFVHTPFQDIGDARGVGAFVHALDKVDEANRMATRLHQMIFRYNRPVWALEANSVDASGRPLPAPRVGNENTGTEDSDTLTLGDDSLLRLPGQSKLGALVPQLNYEAHIKALADHMTELEQDLPELAYYRLREKSDLSGKAVRLLLGDAIAKCVEARGNAETALERADSMALTIGVKAGLFKNIGTFEAGEFDHRFAERDIIPLSEGELAEIYKAETSAGIPLRTSLRRHGASEDELKQLDADLQADAEKTQTTLAQALLKAQREFDQNAAAGSNGKVPEGALNA